METQQSKTVSALAGKQVLITGTTGFIGKVIVEKLMRCVPDIGGIHLLIRANKKYPNAGERFRHEIATSSVFDLIKLNKPEDFEAFCEEKVHYVTGEVTEKYFGLSQEGFTELAEQIDVIINSAASVNFREELDTALGINTLCLNNILALSRCAGDAPVIQVSTCYVNGFNRGYISEEIVAPAGKSLPRSEDGYFEVDELIASLSAKAEAVKASVNDPSTQKAALVDLGIEEAHRYGWNDTYTFTKWMGEQLLLKGMKDKTLTILRPSIVESTLSEPVAGWVEGVKVADAIILAYAREKVALFPGKKRSVIDVIPADLVANSILICTAEALSKGGGRQIYQCCSGSSNPIKVGDFVTHLQEEAKVNHEKYDRLFYRRPKRPFVIVPRAVFHGLMYGLLGAAKLGEKVSALFGVKSKSKIVSNIDTALKLSLIFSAYTAPEYIFCNDKLKALSVRMGEADRQMFPVDAGIYDWKTYLREVHLAGLNQYGLKPRRVYAMKSDKEAQQSKAA